MIVIIIINKCIGKDVLGESKSEKKDVYKWCVCMYDVVSVLLSTMGRWEIIDFLWCSVKFFSVVHFFFLQLPHRIYATYLATVMLYCISHFARSVFLHSSLWLCKRWLGGRKFVGWKRCVCSTIRMTDFYMY